MTAEETNVRAALEAFDQALQAMDFDALEALWDGRCEHFVYQPEEFARPCRSWDEFVAYLNYIPGVVERVREWRELETDVAVLGDAAIVYRIVHISFEFKGVEEPLEGDVRFTFGLRRTTEGWRFIHCHESRQLVLDAATS